MIPCELQDHSLRCMACQLRHYNGIAPTILSSRFLDQEITQSLALSAATMLLFDFNATQSQFFSAFWNELCEIIGVKLLSAADPSTLHERRKILRILQYIVDFEFDPYAM